MNQTLSSPTTLAVRYTPKGVPAHSYNQWQAWIIALAAVADDDYTARLSPGITWNLDSPDSATRTIGLVSLYKFEDLLERLGEQPEWNDERTIRVQAIKVAGQDHSHLADPGLFLDMLCAERLEYVCGGLRNYKMQQQDYQADLESVARWNSQILRERALDKLQGILPVAHKLNYQLTLVKQGADASHAAKIDILLAEYTAILADPGRLNGWINKGKTLTKRINRKLDCVTHAPRPDAGVNWDAQASKKAVIAKVSAKPTTKTKSGKPKGGKK